MTTPPAVVGLQRNLACCKRPTASVRVDHSYVVVRSNIWPALLLFSRVVCGLPSAPMIVRARRYHVTFPCLLVYFCVVRVLAAGVTHLVAAGNFTSCPAKKRLTVVRKQQLQIIVVRQPFLA